MTVDELLARLRAARQATLATYADLDPAQLGERRTWREKPQTQQFLLSWLAEGDDTRIARLLETRVRLGAPLTVAQTAALTGGFTRGRLLGLLVGLPDAFFDQAPAPDEWSVQRTLGHVAATDTRYRLAVEHALARARRGGEGPMRPDESTLPSREGVVEAQGTRVEVMQRLTAAHDAVLRTIVAVPDDLLDAPTNWIAWDLDVRFRIHRFAAHDREHTIQIRKTLAALGVQQNEPQLLLADAQEARGALESLLIATPADILDREPPGGGPSIAAIVAEAAREEQTTLT